MSLQAFNVWQAMNMRSLASPLGSTHALRPSVTLPPILGPPTHHPPIPPRPPTHLPSATTSTSWCSEAPPPAEPALAAAPASMWSSEVSTSTMGRSLMVLSWSNRICGAARQGNEEWRMGGWAGRR